MSSAISYGPHIHGRGHPEQYIRTKYDTILNRQESHEQIQHSLIQAFGRDNPSSLVQQLAEKQQCTPGDPIQLSFINYGNTELVYRAIIGHKKFAVLINQPHTPVMTMQQEFDHLTRLHLLDPRFVIEPYAFYDVSKKGYALYASAYSEDALCIAHSYHSKHIYHGVHNPLPHYHFEPFSPTMSSVINSAMIALLVHYYDHKTYTGLAQVQTSGNDFMLDKNFSHDTCADIIQHMKLIAARGSINTGFEAYLRLLRKEFIHGTQYSDRDVVKQTIKINHRSSLPMTSDEIEEGIQLGLGLRG